MGARRKWKLKNGETYEDWRKFRAEALVKRPFCANFDRLVEHRGRQLLLCVVSFKLDDKFEHHTYEFLVDAERQLYAVDHISAHVARSCWRETPYLFFSRHVYEQALVSFNEAVA